MDDIPSAAGAGDSTIATRPTFKWEELSALAARFGGPYELVKMLPSERDQNFLLRPAGKSGDCEADCVVLKVHNPTDDLAFVECQSQALERSAASGASCQKILRTKDTKEMIVAIRETSKGEKGGICQCRALTFLPGQMLADAAGAVVNDASARSALFGEVGLAVGSVTAALLGFEHKAAVQEGFSWDLVNCEEVIQSHLVDVVDERRPLLESFLERYRRDVKPLLPRLRRSVVHNDPNDYNIVVGADGGVGVLDFGDMVHSYAVADAAIGLAYLLFHCPADAPLAESSLPFVRRFHEKCPLTKDEAQALFGLAVMRVCTSVSMSSYQSRLEPDNPYLLISAKPAWALLDRLADGKEESSTPALFRSACGHSAEDDGPVMKQAKI